MRSSGVGDEGAAYRPGPAGGDARAADAPRAQGAGTAASASALPLPSRAGKACSSAASCQRGREGRGEGGDDAGGGGRRRNGGGAALRRATHARPCCWGAGGAGMAGAPPCAEQRMRDHVAGGRAAPEWRGRRLAPSNACATMLLGGGRRRNGGGAAPTVSRLALPRPKLAGACVRSCSPKAVLSHPGGAASIDALAAFVHKC